MLLQERMHLRPRVVSKQSPQLGGRELPSTVCLEGKCFQRCTGQIFALCRQVSGNVFGEIKGDPHKAILRASKCRRQPPTAPFFEYLAPSESADEMMVSLTFANWNQIVGWLRRLEGLRSAA